MIGKNSNNATPGDAPEGIIRRTLAFNPDAMLCHFEMKQGAQIPQHHHEAVQVGYVVSGRLLFKSGRNPDGFEAKAGDSYVFDSNEPHGADVLEDTVAVEVFTPSRPEYED